MTYEKPQVVDYGGLQTLTLATGAIGTEDGAGKTINAEVGPVEVSIGVLP